MLFYLLKFVKKYIDAGKSLSDAFKDFAHHQGYTAKSVKKCFNLAVQGFDSHPKLAKWLELDLQELKDPANSFNMSAVKSFVLENGKNADKCFYVLCLGDHKEATALKKRFDKFFPDFFDEKALPQERSDSFADKHNLFPLELQMQYFESTAKHPRNYFSP